MIKNKKKFEPYIVVGGEALDRIQFELEHHPTCAYFDEDMIALVLSKLASPDNPKKKVWWLSWGLFWKGLELIGVLILLYIIAAIVAGVVL